MKSNLCCSILVLLLLSACQQDAAEVGGAAAAPAPSATPVTAATPARPAAPPAAAVDGLARFSGYGDMVLGSSAADAVNAWAGELQGEASEPGGCHYLSPKGARIISDLAFMIEGDRFVRYDVGSPAQVAPGGGKVGMSVQELESLYGKLESAPHKYVDGGQYLSRPAGGGAPTKLVFEANAAGMVTAWRVGVEPQVDYVEGCS